MTTIKCQYCDAFIRKSDTHFCSMDAIGKYINRLREALDRIARPLWWIQEDAKVNNMQVNGGMASQLANDPNYLSSIAKKALSNE